MALMPNQTHVLHGWINGRTDWEFKNGPLRCITSDIYLDGWLDGELCEPKNETIEIYMSLNAYFPSQACLYVNTMLLCSMYMFMREHRRVYYMESVYLTGVGVIWQLVRNFVGLMLMQL